MGIYTLQVKVMAKGISNKIKQKRDHFTKKRKENAFNSIFYCHNLTTKRDIRLSERLIFGLKVIQHRSHSYINEEKSKGKLFHAIENCVCVWKTISRSRTCTNINDS